MLQLHLACLEFEAALHGLAWRRKFPTSPGTTCAEQDLGCACIPHRQFGSRNPAESGECPETVPSACH